MIDRMDDKKEEQWEKVFTTNTLYQAEIFKAVLEEENITSVIINKLDSSYLSFGEIEVYVNCDDLLRAKQVATKFNTHE